MDHFLTNVIHPPILLERPHTQCIVICTLEFFSSANQQICRFAFYCCPCSAHEIGSFAVFSGTAFVQKDLAADLTNIVVDSKTSLIIIFVLYLRDIDITTGGLSQRMIVRIVSATGGADIKRVFESNENEYDSLRGHAVFR